MNRNEQKIIEARATALEKARAYKRLFNTPDGRVVLKDLAEEFARSGLNAPGDPFLTHVRVGEHGVIQYIHNVMEAATDE